MKFNEFTKLTYFCHFPVQSLLVSALSVESRNGKEQSTGLSVSAACLRCAQRPFRVGYSGVRGAPSPAAVSLHCPAWKAQEEAESLLLALPASAGLKDCFETGKTVEVRCSNSARAASL